jgi:predicted RNA-binding protein YlqC (UPF0109 family)
MVELVKYIINTFAEKPELVEYTVTENGKNVDILVVLDESDMGKVIGRQGKIAKAMRTLVKSASSKEGKKYNIEIKERGEI